MPVLVTDFDGTITRLDFYRLVIDELLPPDSPDYWTEYTEGRLSHFEALNRTFAAAPAAAEQLAALADRMEPDPRLAEHLKALREHGWNVTIVSAGCRWYIDRILSKAGAMGLAEVHASPGEIEEGRLRMRLPVDSPYFSPDTGIDKSAVVNAALATGEIVAFAGNGPPDIAPSLLVPSGLRFARADLAEALRSLGRSFREFNVWGEVAQALLDSGSNDSPR